MLKKSLFFFILITFFLYFSAHKLRAQTIDLSKIDAALHYFWNANGSVNTTGLVSNSSGNYISVTLKIEYLDASGKALEVAGFSQAIRQELGGSDKANFDTHVLAHGVLAPNEKIAFHATRDLKNIKGTPVKARVTVFKANWKDKRCNYSLNAFTQTDITNGKQFSVDVLNNCDAKDTRQSPQITLAFFDEKNYVIGVQSFEHKLPFEGLQKGKSIKIEGKVYNPFGTQYKMKTIKISTSYRL